MTVDFRKYYEVCTLALGARYAFMLLLWKFNCCQQLDFSIMTFDSAPAANLIVMT